MDKTRTKDAAATRGVRIADAVGAITAGFAKTVGATADIVYSVLKQTSESGLSELQLVAAQDEIVSPTYHFDVTQVR